MNPYLMLLAAIGLVTYSNIIVKARLNVLDTGITKSAPQFFLAVIMDPLIWSAVVATAVAMVFYLLALRRIDVSVAQPALALVFVAVPISAAIFLGESLSGARFAGLGCMAFGVFLVLRSA